MPMTLQQFGQRVKSKHPEYGSLSDEDVAQRVIQKYPEYQSEVLGGPAITAKKSVGGFLGNVVKSSANLIGSTASAIFQPIETIKSVGKLGLGAAEKLIPGQQSHEVYVDALSNFFKGRYGSVGKALETMYSDPAGVALDLSTILSGGGTALAKLGTLGKLEKFANIASKVERTAAIEKAIKAGELGKIATAGQGIASLGAKIDPLRAITKTASLVPKTIGKLGEVGLGLSTGTGPEYVRAGFNAAKAGGEAGTEFKSAMRGNLTAEDILANTKEALGTVKENRRTQYVSDLENVQKDTMVTKNGELYIKRPVTEADVRAGLAPKSSVGKTSFVSTKLSTLGLKKIATQTLKDLLGADVKGKGVTEFIEKNRPSLDSRNIQKVVDLLYGWQDLTPLGLNKLRQEIVSFEKAGIKLAPAENRFNKFVNDLGHGLNEYLKERVPTIKPLNENYAKASEMIKDIDKTLSLGNNISPDTAIRKITSSLKDINEHRRSVLGDLEKASGTNLKSSIAGQRFNQFMPRALGQVLAGGGGLGVVSGLIHAVSPGMITTLAATSPRLVGEFINALGVTAKVASDISAKVNSVRQMIQLGVPNQVINNFITQAGRANGVTSQKQ